MFNLFANGGRTNIKMTKWPPINVLPNTNDRKNGIFPPLHFVFQRRNTDVEKRENEVGAAERLFTSEKRFKFKFAIMAVDRPGRDDRNKEYRLLDSLLDFGFPQLARSDRLLILL
jgi:hypothetical protein